MLAVTPALPALFNTTNLSCGTATYTYTIDGGRAAGSSTLQAVPAALTAAITKDTNNQLEFDQAVLNVEMIKLGVKALDFTIEASTAYGTIGTKKATLT